MRLAPEAGAAVTRSTSAEPDSCSFPLTTTPYVPCGAAAAANRHTPMSTAPIGKTPSGWADLLGQIPDAGGPRAAQGRGVGNGHDCRLGRSTRSAVRGLYREARDGAGCVCVE